MDSQSFRGVCRASATTNLIGFLVVFLLISARFGALVQLWGDETHSLNVAAQPLDAILAADPFHLPTSYLSLHLLAPLFPAGLEWPTKRMGASGSLSMAGLARSLFFQIRPLLCKLLALQRGGRGRRLWAPLLWGCLVAVGLANLQQVVAPTLRLYSQIPYPAIARDAVAAASERQLPQIAISRHTLNALSVERFARPHLAAGAHLQIVTIPAG